MRRHGPWQVVGTHEVYRDGWLTLTKDEVIRPDGGPGTFSVIRVRPGASVLALDALAADDQPPNFKITTKRKDDSVEVRREKGRAVFIVTSPFGISQATVERQEETWPKEVAVRLRLKGPSSFRTSNGKVTVNTAVSVQEGKPKVRLWKDGKEDAPLDEKSPCGRTSASWAAAASRPRNSAQGRLLRGGAAQGVLRGHPQGDRAELDRLLPGVSGLSPERHSPRSTTSYNGQALAGG
jgi:hypothetical protein